MRIPHVHRQDRTDLRNDFARRIREREFPTCPPQQLDNDGLLSFSNPRTGAREFHHGGVFGLTRWTNIYFPLEQGFWGDAIGGPLAPIFGSHVLDVPVSTRAAGGADFFTHTAYWDVARPKGATRPTSSPCARPSTFPIKELPSI